MHQSSIKCGHLVLYILKNTKTLKQICLHDAALLVTYGRTNRLVIPVFYIHEARKRTILSTRSHFTIGKISRLHSFPGRTIPPLLSLKPTFDVNRDINKLLPGGDTVRAYSHILSYIHTQGNNAQAGTNSSPKKARFKGIECHQNEI